MCAKIWCTNFQPSSCYKKVASLSWKHCTYLKSVQVLKNQYNCALGYGALDRFDNGAN